METSTTSAQQATQQSDKPGLFVSLVPSSHPMDQAQAQRVPDPSRSRPGYKRRTPICAKRELLTDQASMVEYLLDTHYHHGWCSKLEIGDHESLLLATPGLLVNLHNQIT